MYSDDCCHCACHEYPGAYPTTDARPCLICGHVNEHGEWIGGYRGYWQKTQRQCVGCGRVYKPEESRLRKTHDAEQFCSAYCETVQTWDSWGEDRHILETRRRAAGDGGRESGEWGIGMAQKTQKCRGFGKYEGRCQNVAGSSHSPIWCQRCEDLRQEHITQQLELMLKQFTEGK